MKEQDSKIRINIFEKDLNRTCGRKKKVIESKTHFTLVNVT